MKNLNLNGKWKMSSSDDKLNCVEGQVPGSVYSFLLNSNKMEDPFYRENELPSLELMKKDYSFSRDFTIEKNLIECNEIILKCHGLDTLCTIRINDKEIGSAFNMFRSWEFDVKKVLQEGKNKIEIFFPSSVNYIRDMDDKNHVGGSIHSMRGFPHLRKAHCMFGWDWGPRLPDAGIWKDIELIGIDSSYIKDVNISQNHRNNDVSIKIKVDQSKSANVIIELEDPTGNKNIIENNKSYIIKNPRIWWPNGLGQQPLYKVRVTLIENGIVVDSNTKKIGLRTLTLTQKKDEWGESFSHCVNGVDFFAMGADYIPEDIILSRITDEKTRNLLLQCKQSNFNVIRIWGGGYYPSDDFFDACDEYGLVVWQDFMFACANYPLDDEFEDNIKKEIEQNVKRIMHHPSLGLWCGNNEMEQFEITGKYDSNEKTRADYIKMYEYIIPKTLKQYDTVTPYWPSSPSSGGSFDDPTDPNRGDAHYWDVWHGQKPFTEYRKFKFRYVSEFGFQSFPEMKTIETYTLPKDRNIFTRVMERHQRNPGANGLILTYLSKTFLYPKDLPTLVYASQLLQAESIKYGVEHWRRNRGICMGSVYWQLNDIWPVASWASIDYFGRWKALQYVAKRFYSPLLISCEENGERDQITDIVLENEKPIETTARFNISNEMRTSNKGLLKWSLRSSDSSIIEAGEKNIEVGPLESKWIQYLDFNRTEIQENHLWFEFIQDGHVVTRDSVLFTNPKHYNFRDPKLTCKIVDNKIVVKSDCFAKYVEIYSDDSDFILEDNFFDMEKGERFVEIQNGSLKNLKVRSIFDIR
jgi:beta-mannosidase